MLLVDIPEDVDADGVHAECLTHLNAVLPVRTGNTGIVHFGGLYHEGLAVKQEGLVARGERAWFVAGSHHAT